MRCGDGDVGVADAGGGRGVEETPGVDVAGACHRRATAQTGTSTYMTSEHEHYTRNASNNNVAAAALLGRCFSVSRGGLLDPHFFLLARNSLDRKNDKNVPNGFAAFHSKGRYQH